MFIESNCKNWNNSVINVSKICSMRKEKIIDNHPYIIKFYFSNNSDCWHYDDESVRNSDFEYIKSFLGGD